MGSSKMCASDAGKIRSSELMTQFQKPDGLTVDSFGFVILAPIEA